MLFEEDQAREIASAKIWNIYLKIYGNAVDDYDIRGVGVGIAAEQTATAAAVEVSAKKATIAESM